MTGNIREWCWDWFRAPTYAPITSTTSQYGLSPSEASNNQHTLRGGGCGSAANVTSLYVSGREGNTDTTRNNVFGFRVVRNAGVTANEKYTVTFDTTTNCPGNKTKIYRQKISAGGYAVAPSLSNPAPVDANGNRHGNFLGWYTKPMPQQNPASGSTTPIDSPFDFAHTPITGNLTLYAVWDFVYVEGGTVVGSDDYNPNRDSTNGDYKGAFPAGRTVTLSSFYISDHELTQGEYETYCCYTSSTPSSSYGVGQDNPAYNVSWYDAIVYCNLRSMAEGLTPCYSLGDNTNPTQWEGIKESSGKYSCSYTSSNSTWDSITCDITANGYRLPTEAEWEYAARGGQKTYGTDKFAYYFAGATTASPTAIKNSDLDSVGWYKYNICNDGITGDSEASSGSPGYGTHEIKQKAPNALGLYDMSGNVYEWCWDWYSDSVGTGSVTDPCGASTGTHRILRGGSWYENIAYFCSVSKRRGVYPVENSADRGFRLVRSAQ